MMPVYSNLDKWRHMPQREPDPKTVCNFCKQVTSEDKLIAGPGVNICTECVELCNEIITDRRSQHRDKAIKEMVKLLCERDTTLTVERAIALASGAFDAGYRKEVI
ncbi:hypothetical protein NYO12_21440 [Klebsiella variicola]|uniref:ClpX C4-type zinc finger protein n=1 Tax=Klebsiella variicola TaxID=244366 RepID=UPI0021675DD7|nr:ClpX C4-type zinc finger protein [Klebsiella variicola]UVW51131.1 hypothetical protein NYO12_18280 [Klebsiella variicola]UVW51699.1 hypothetical protein NYO12_21440 [Klebsiella variicola]